MIQRSSLPCCCMRQGYQLVNSHKYFRNPIYYYEPGVFQSIIRLPLLFHHLPFTTQRSLRSVLSRNASTIRDKSRYLTYTDLLSIKEGRNEANGVLLENLPSPPLERAFESAKLAALHSRINLSAKFPIQTLARALITKSADSDIRFNNSTLEILGSDLLGFHTSEYIICQYPRIPVSLLFAAQAAFVGDKALSIIGKEWGIETAAEPGGEVDPGLLQFRKKVEDVDYSFPGNSKNESNEKCCRYRRGLSFRIVYNDQFGNVTSRQSVTPEIASSDYVKNDEININSRMTTEQAYASFVRALVGGVYIHNGKEAFKNFVKAHFLSRKLDLSEMFEFNNPMRGLKVLCAREGLDLPEVKLLSETGRNSRHPVFVIGIFSRGEKIGEGAGSSLTEARTRAAAAALKSWYLYSPLELSLPSDCDHESKLGTWKANFIDQGEVIL